MSFYPEQGTEKVYLEGSSAIIVSSATALHLVFPLKVADTGSQAPVSLGNVPQLAVDVVLANTPLQRIGFIGDGSTTVPFVGAAEASSSGGQASSGIVTGGLEGT